MRGFLFLVKEWVFETCSRHFCPIIRTMFMNSLKRVGVLIYKDDFYDSIDQVSENLRPSFILLLFFLICQQR